jgi:hypothetical protein
VIINLSFFFSRKRWCDSYKYSDDDDYSIHLPQSAELILTGTCSTEEYRLFIYDHSHLFNTMPLSRLNIDNYELSVGLLVKLLYDLPNIISLRISSFPTDIYKTVCSKGTKDFDFVSNNNNITKVCLEQMDELKVMQFVFLNLWRRVICLEMTCTKDVSIEMVIRIIFKNYTKCIPHLRFLCLGVTNVNDKMVEQLQTVIDLQQSLINYIIKHRNNKLYFQWK